MRVGHQNKPRRQNRFSISILICFNIVFALCGLAILTLGVLVLRDVSRELLFRLVSPNSPIIGQVGGALLAIGAFAFLTAILGCSTAAKKCSIGWYICCVILVLVAELALGVSFLIFIDSNSHEIEPNNLVSKLQSDFGVNQPFTQSLDFTQYKFKCCGIESDSDYDRSTWKTGKLGGSELSLPLTCCPLDENNSDHPPFMNPIPSNITLCQNPNSPKHQRYRDGCLSSIENWFRQQTLTFVGMGLTLLLLQIASLSAAICLCRKIK